MLAFKKQILKKTTSESVPGDCVTLVSFSYKGVGNITFTYTKCDGTIESSTHNLPNTGGDYQTYPADALEPNIPCIKEGSISASIVNVHDYVTTPGCL